MSARRLSAAVAAVSVVAAVAACKGASREAAPASGAGSAVAAPAPGSAGSGSAATPAAAVSPEVAALPGTIWFVRGDGDLALARLRAGAVTAYDANVFPGGDRFLGDVVVIRSKGVDAADNEQLELLADDGTYRALGLTGFQVRSPAGGNKWLVVAANVDGHSDLYRIDGTGDDRTAKRITNTKEGNFHPTSIGPAAVAFASSRDGDSEIYRMDVTGKNVQRLTAFHKDDWDPVATADGATIAFLSDRESKTRIFLMARDGTGQRRLTGTDADRADAAWEEAQPAWSPDGTRVAYVWQRGAEHRVFVRDLATGTEQAITPDGASDQEPAFSPDGAWLVVARETRRDDVPDHDLWAVPLGAAAGRVPLQLTRGGGIEQQPHWLGD